MTAALRTDLNNFLFTPIASDASGMHLTMLSALARSGVDPWAEAAGLAALSRESATQKLMLLLAGVPNGPSPGDDTATLAARLVEQLHSSAGRRTKPVTSTMPATDTGKETPLVSFARLPQGVKLAIYSLMALILMILCFRALTSSDASPSSDIGKSRSIWQEVATVA